MVKYRWDRRLPRFIGRLYAIIIRLMLHFSLVFGFFKCSRGIYHWGLLHVYAKLLGYGRMLGHLDEMAGEG